MLTIKLKKKEKPISGEYVNLDFIPYACHYDDEIILTKQGELLKIIKLEDYSSLDRYGDLRTEIRKSILKNVDSSNFTVWVHTVRKHNKVNLHWNSTNDFSDYLHSTWFDRLTDNKLRYINELYIVILLHNFDEHIHNSLFFNHIKNKHKHLLDEKSGRLQKVAESIKNDLKPFGAKMLGLRFQNGAVYSEMVEFLHYIATLTHKEYKISERDLSQSVKNLKVAFGFNTFKTTFDDQQKFGAVFSLKEYREIPLSSIDACLQIESELIITEVVIFTNKATKELKKQINMLQISEDDNLIKSSGIGEILNYEKEEAGVNFCQQKIIITLFANDKKKLDENVNNLSSIMSNIGLMMFRTDLHMENHFWAQLPGNFIFVTQTKHILVKYACSFAMLHDFTSGALKGGRWKEAITIFFSNKGNPYFFNFHGKKK